MSDDHARPASFGDFEESVAQVECPPGHTEVQGKYKHERAFRSDKDGSVAYYGDVRDRGKRPVGFATRLERIAASLRRGFAIMAGHAGLQYTRTQGCRRR